VASGTDILEALRNEKSPEEAGIIRPPSTAPESMDALRLLRLIREASGNMVLAVSEFGAVSGLITPVDIFEIIAGEFREEGEKPDITDLPDGALLVHGHADLHLLEQHLEMEGLLPPDDDYGTVAGLLLDNLGHLPVRGEKLEAHGLRFTVEKVSSRRIEEVRIERLEEE
jgi:CBS domain containing-hemolysin-like protein